MATSDAMVSLFKEQLEHECPDLATKHGLTSRTESLAWWYFSRLHGLKDAEIKELICDGGGDLAVDAIWIDQNQIVRFYQFKNPFDPAKNVEGGEVDKVLAGLKLILHRKHEQVANGKVRELVTRIYNIVPTGYRLFFVSSGQGISAESKLKLDAFTEELQAPSESFFTWEARTLRKLQDQFYQKTLPAVEDPIVLSQPKTPYSVRSAAADCYFTHTNGRILAELYGKYGESLLQRNIRVDQHDTPTNRSIEATCSGSDSANFLHYNNGVTFICDAATYDQFQNNLTLQRAQVVNGGQTVRALARALRKGKLKDPVLVPVRVITSNGDREFGNNVAVNQNNQNQMRTGFLRSNDPQVVQLSHALASLGWYLEKREGEIGAASPEELAAIQHKIGRPIQGRVIKLKEGTQSYVATFFAQPELAKKDPKKMFGAGADGGYFERIFSAELTAEKFAIAHETKQAVDSFVKFLLGCKKRKDKSNDLSEYRDVFGDSITEKFGDQIDQVIRQSAIFLCGSVFKDYVEGQPRTEAGAQGAVAGKRRVTIEQPVPTDLPAFLLSQAGKALMAEHLGHLLEYAHQHPKKFNKSWPNLLKSSAFFNEVVAHILGIRKGQQSKASPRS